MMKNSLSLIVRIALFFSSLFVSAQVNAQQPAGGSAAGGNSGAGAGVLQLKTGVAVARNSKTGVLPQLKTDAAVVRHTFALGDSTFLLDGKPLQLISGDMHYTRVPREYWRDRMKMAKAMGLNTIGTYVFWNVHEAEKGKYDFTGNNDIAEFVRTAGEEGLWVVLRPSPYVCAEWEFGGYPWWLLKDSTMKVRSKDPRFVEAYRTYINKLAVQLAPLQVTRGGNILMVQVENEYGSYSDDKSYLDLNRKIFREAGFDGILFTCDGGEQMGKGYLPGYLPAVNGETDPVRIKALINQYHGGKGPYYVAEWYPGWFDDWGKPHARTPVDRDAATLDKILGAGISINMYMFHGGTTRGFMNGANMNQHSPYSPQVSSYDYDSPLDESGNPTEKYYAFRKVIERHLPSGSVLPSVPERKAAAALPPIRLTATAGVFNQLGKPVEARTPLCFEDLGLGYGFVLYRTQLKGNGNGWLAIKQLRDYAIVYANGKKLATLDRRLGQDSVWLDGVAANAVLDILVENNGRINYGPFLTDNRQGITRAVVLNGQELYNWKMYRLPFGTVDGFIFKGEAGAVKGQPALYKGSFMVGELHDTYLDMRGWGKGFVFLNGHNLGKYWEIGPQQTLYVPAGWLKKGVNEVVVFDALNDGHGGASMGAGPSGVRGTGGAASSGASGMAGSAVVGTGAVLRTLSAPVLNELSQATAARYPIIPFPTSLTPADGEFEVTPVTVMMVPAVFEKEGVALNKFFANSFGRGLMVGRPEERPLVVGTAGDVVWEKPFIELRQDTSITAEEGYKILITGGQVLLSARTSAGMFMAVQTIRQLLPAAVEGAGGVGARAAGARVAGAGEAARGSDAGGRAQRLVLPAVTIQDAPAYGWRGMHLDVSRHFFSIAYLRKFIDVMALYKMNKFHLHLTDDQGWRIEIKKYPLLTEKGAWRTFNNQDSACMQRAADNPDMAIDPSHIIQKDGVTLYGGYYTQDEMRALVAYAADRHIDIIPEIDMPGHMMAAINQYNYLSCDGTSVFGELFSTPICPCLPTTFQFAQDIYSEIMDIFPSTYLHIGGDEVDRSLWAKSDACKQLMEHEGVKNTAQLQSYFIGKMEQFFNSKGRKLIGWDEILEGGISKTAMVMYWRTWVPKAPVEAAQNGNSVIMTPGNPLYFDNPQDKNSLPGVYHFNPVPQGLTWAQAKNIIGAQANIWTENIPSENRADYMYMPRMTALAEVLWTARGDYDSYLRRLRAGYNRLDVLKVRYRLPDLTGFLSRNVFTDKDTLWIKKPLEDLTIRYTTDGTAPGMYSTVLSAPLVIRGSQQVRVAAFRTDGSHGDVYDISYQKETLATPETVGRVEEGLVCSQYKSSFKMTTQMPDGHPDTVMTVSSVAVPTVLEAPAFGLKYRGYLDIPQDGIYSFFLTCDDGGVLNIAGREVVNNDGNHAPIEKNGQVALKKGLQRLALDFIEGGGGYTFRLKYSYNGGEPQDIPAGWLKH